MQDLISVAPDERLWVQGGMMEEWHQKLHHNTSPDDVIICQALLDYIDSGLDISTYWATLKVWHILIPIRSFQHAHLASGPAHCKQSHQSRNLRISWSGGPVAALLHGISTMPQSGLEHVPDLLAH